MLAISTERDFAEPELIDRVDLLKAKGESAQAQSDGEFDWSLRPRLPFWLPKRMAAVIARDEARHVAFGKVYLRGSLPSLSLKQRLAIYGWMRDLWIDTARGVAGEFSPPGLFFGRRNFDRWLERKWTERLDDLMAAGLFNADERGVFEAT